MKTEIGPGGSGFSGPAAAGAGAGTAGNCAMMTGIDDLALAVGAAVVVPVVTDGNASEIRWPALAGAVVVFSSVAATFVPVGVAGRVLANASRGSAAATAGAGVNKRGCENSVGSTGWLVTRTRTPTLVVRKSRLANASGKRMQPCDAGCPGTTPWCIAMPDHVMRCI